MTDDFAPLSIASYAAAARRTDQRSDSASMTFPMLGLFGEAGSLLSEVKKKQRDRASYLGYAQAVVEELGDVLWYLATVADRAGLKLEEVASPFSKNGDTNGSLTFAALQPEIMERPGDPSAAFERTLLRLAGAVGVLIADHEAGAFDDISSGFAERLAAVLKFLIEAANEAGVTLEAAAIKNLAKINDRWPSERQYPDLLDIDADPEEQLPRDLFIEIFERDVGGRRFVFQRCNGINIGDRLTDNAMTADDYRFHDAFHYAYVAVLGWSPVTRSLFRLKRKSDAKLDEAQDGARAALIEEGVTTWVFGQAVNLNLFAGMNPGDLPFDLLKNVRQFVSGYEVDACPLWLWEEAILEGYSTFRFLRENRRGLLHVDASARRLKIENLK